MNVRHFEEYLQRNFPLKKTTSAEHCKFLKRPQAAQSIFFKMTGREIQMILSSQCIFLKMTQVEQCNFSKMAPSEHPGGGLFFFLSQRTLDLNTKMIHMH
jgi:hypothetical protein